MVRSWLNRLLCRVTEVRTGYFGKFHPEQLAAQHVALAGLSGSFGVMLDVARLTFDKETVDHRALRIREDPEVDAEADEREKIHRFARVEQVAVLQDAVSA